MSTPCMENANSDYFNDRATLSSENVGFAMNFLNLSNIFFTYLSFSLKIIVLSLGESISDILFRWACEDGKVVCEVD